MDRPLTSKSRGICRFYSTPRGCFAGDDCKFLHGADERLTPYDKSKVCIYYAKGHCTRGDKCWFRHVLPKVAADDERIQFSGETCCICLEKPKVYGLLTDCSHVFCLECIRQWRVHTGKSLDLISSGMLKCCPLCRTASRFVTPSAHFFPNGSSRKKETIDAYKASMAKVPCKYFEETLRAGKPCCPFGIDCFYRHTNPDGTQHVFTHGAKHSMNIYRRRNLRRANLPAHFDYDDPIEFLQHIFENPNTNLHATLDVIRASLPAFMERFRSTNGPGTHDSDDEEIMDDFIDPFELLRLVALTFATCYHVIHSNASRKQEDYSITLDDAPVPSTAGNSRQSTPTESLPEHVPLPASTPSFLETPATSEPQPGPLSRFSTIMGIPNRETFIIDISDEEEEEEEDSTPHVDIEPYNSTDLGPPPLESIPIPLSPPEQPQSALQSVGNIGVDMTPVRPQCEHDVDPPFVTDGRGRVVWSSTRNAGRGAVPEGRARHSRTGSTPRVACPSPSSTHITPNARGHAWGGQDALALDGKVVGGEGSSDMD